MTHAELVVRAGKWLRRMGCGLVLEEVVTAQSEQPDAIGWRNSGRQSILVECKASRADFFADRNKTFRGGASPAMGEIRFYMTPPGLVKVEELLPGWGLLYCHPKKIERIHGYNLSDFRWQGEFSHDYYQRGELCMMYSALSRLRLDLGEEAFRTAIHMPYAERLKKKKAKGE